MPVVERKNKDENANLLSPRKQLSAAVAFFNFIDLLTIKDSARITEEINIRKKQDNSILLLMSYGEEIFSEFSNEIYLQGKFSTNVTSQSKKKQRVGRRDLRRLRQFSLLHV
ncbi:CLUMA_CG014861, isoform A [Clunio marinus]|uniref:CLUMA_CG014861, isoform A n=1 Tax=Clunio marinus TaxID=568069 RepID=A0A1J1IRD9_9DIPT|nr:CLUMA_CG014861, isoform A [Clunio marinus]